jgi:hypothetical protein
VVRISIYICIISMLGKYISSQIMCLITTSAGGRPVRIPGLVCSSLIHRRPPPWNKVTFLRQLKEQ